MLSVENINRRIEDGIALICNNKECKDRGLEFSREYNILNATHEGNTYLACLSQSKLLERIDATLAEIKEKSKSDKQKIEMVIKELGSIDPVVYSLFHNADAKCGICNGNPEDDFCEFCSAVPYHAQKSDYSSLGQCMVWLNRIQGKDKLTISQEDLDKIVDYLKKNVRDITTVSCVNIRYALEKTGLSKYNINVVSILYRITGIAPYELTYSENEKALMYFKKINDIYSSMFSGSSIMSYPYFIYKILEQILPHGERRSKILSYIHIQSSSTVQKNDLIWKEICNTMADPNIKYIPTRTTRS